MGLVKRGNTWWMSFMYRGASKSDGRQGRQISGWLRQFLERFEHRLSKGDSSRSRKKQSHTFEELMERYLTEHAARRANRRREQYCVNNLKGFFGNPQVGSHHSEADRHIQE